MSAPQKSAARSHTSSSMSQRPLEHEQRAALAAAAAASSSSSVLSSASHVNHQMNGEDNDDDEENEPNYEEGADSDFDPNESVIHSSADEQELEPEPDELDDMEDNETTETTGRGVLTEEQADALREEAEARYNENWFGYNSLEFHRRHGVDLLAYKYCTPKQIAKINKRLEAENVELTKRGEPLNMLIQVMETGEVCEVQPGKDAASSSAVGTSSSSSSSSSATVPMDTTSRKSRKSTANPTVSDTHTQGGAQMQDGETDAARLRAAAKRLEKMNAAGK